MIHILPAYPAIGYPKRYELKMCKLQDKCNTKPSGLSILGRSSSETFSFTHYAESHAACGRDEALSLSSQIMGLNFLQVCRQVYHEAAPRSFSQCSFSYTLYTHYPDSKPGLRAFLEGLVPTQARAITHLRLDIQDVGFMSQATVEKLRGLERLDIVLQIFKPDYPIVIPDGLVELMNHPGLNSIRRLRLKLLNVACEATCDDSDLTEADKDDVTSWMDILKSRLLP